MFGQVLLDVFLCDIFTHAVADLNSDTALQQ